MGAVSHDSGVRDKRYASHTLLVDLQDAECETKAWSMSGFTITDGRRSVLDQFVDDAILVGVFRFADEDAHGLFEARIEKLDRDRGLLGAHFMWISDEGRSL